MTDSIFGPSGRLARGLPGYEPRPEQEQMAAAVQRAFAEEAALIVEAGTGTGKTLAYLVPAALSGNRVVISTGTKTLQEQIFFRDVPFLQKKLGFSFRASFMKGRGNYLCWRRLRLFTQQPLLHGLEEVAHLRLLRNWAAKTRSGDRAEMQNLPEDLGLWKEVCAGSETCLGQACEDFQRCFITRMRQEAAASDVMIVNHHLFFADLAVRIRGYGEVLPRYEAVIFDEAHQLEEVATQYFGLVVSNYRFEELARDLRREMAAAKIKDPAFMEISTRILEAEESFFRSFGQGEARFRLREARVQRELAAPADKLRGQLEVLSLHVGGLKEASEGLRTLARRAEELKGQFEQVLGLREPGLVYWGEVRGRGVFLHASPIDISSDLKVHLFPHVKTLVFTSATLSTQGHFHFFRQRVGLEGDCGEGTRELMLESSFEMSRQALLYLPREMPEPNHADFIGRAAEEIKEILERTRGRAFLLFTSIRNMEEAFGLLRGRLPYTCFLQGERPKSALLAAFKEDLHSVLFATASFWEGVDVQGEALSCVVVDRLPFSPPNDPILEARLDRIASSGGSPFWEYQVPSAIILLKQGLGRLIRTRQDRGVLAILDPRVMTRGYGKAFLDSLPSCPVTRDLKEIERFFAPPPSSTKMEGRSA